jgi:hypothetical protein
MKGAIIYISSNKEKPEFENKIIVDMLEKSEGLEVFSVTQKPTPFPNNIVVGDVGASGFNFCRQLQMVIESAKVDYVISCEADCLYSPDYFEFVPPKLDRVYRNTHNFVLTYGQDTFYTKDSQTAFQIAGRDFLLDRLNLLLENQPQWSTEMKNFPKEIGLPFLESWDTFKTKYGCFQIKTAEAMRKQTHHGKEPLSELPYWGTAKQIREKYL